MKSLLIFVICALTTGAAEKAQAFDQMCGFVGDIISYIKTNSNEKITMNVGVYGHQGEAGRRIIGFRSGAWLVTYEFFTSGPVDHDVSCIVASGMAGDDTAVEMTTRLLEKLPDARYKDFGKDPADLVPLKSFRPASSMPAPEKTLEAPKEPVPGLVET